jgi:hypothetical protein
VHTLVFAAGAAIAIALAGVAICSGIIKATACVVASFVPMFLLYMGFRNEPNPIWFLWPVYLLAVILIGKHLQATWQYLPTRKGVAAAAKPATHWIDR